MRSAEKQELNDIVSLRVGPLCPLFGKCGGCSYQDLSYPDELQLKETILKKIISDKISINADVFRQIIPSPKPYHYRNRIDLKLKKTKSNEVFIGFNPADGKGVLPVEKCYIAMNEISDRIKEIKSLAVKKVAENGYKNANLVVRAGDDGRVLWGGIGRRSTRLDTKDYFWTEINGKRIFYSLDTFFQANLSILQKVFDEISLLDIWGENTVLYDLYGGVGFFGVGLIHNVKKVILIEECASSVNIARHNVEYNKITDFDINLGRVEDELPKVLRDTHDFINVAMIDPPRAGLSNSAISLLLETKGIDYILYLSCNPEALARDLVSFVKDRWEIKRIMPFDFFPKTKHLETLVLLKKWDSTLFL